eukprot:1192955-Prorocentrum_minimum.AAC.2
MTRGGGANNSGNGYKYFKEGVRIPRGGGERTSGGGMNTSGRGRADLGADEGELHGCRLASRAVRVRLPRQSLQIQIGPHQPRHLANVHRRCSRLRSALDPRPFRVLGCWGFRVLSAVIAKSATV